MDFVKLVPHAKIPTKAYEGDAGLDLYLSEDVIIRPQEFVDAPTGVAGALPDGTWGKISGRSSTLRNYGLVVAEGVIDQGFRGELLIGLFNVSRSAVRLSEGSRVAQLIIMPRFMQDQSACEVEQLPPGERGLSGFGSSGA